MALHWQCTVHRIVGHAACAERGSRLMFPLLVGSLTESEQHIRTYCIVCSVQPLNPCPLAPQAHNLTNQHQPSSRVIISLVVEALTEQEHHR